MIRVPSNEVDYDFKAAIYLRGGEPFTGMTYSLYPNGALSAETEFRDGLGWGISRGWHPDGRLSGEAWFLRDVRRGIGREWDEAGRLVEESYCEYGIVVSRKEWNEEGLLIRDYQLKEGDPDYEDLQLRRTLYGKDEADGASR